MEDYIHRAGRTARMELLGIVSTIASLLDFGMIDAIEKTLDQKIPRCSVPGVEPFVEKKVVPFGRAGRRRKKFL